MSRDEPNIQPPSPSDDTVDELPDGSVPARSRKKTCCNCGKDLVGHRRFKDSVGYWCKDCHRTDKARHKALETKCPDCGRPVPINSLQQYQDRRVCFNCYKEAMTRDRREYSKKVSAAEHSKHEKARLMILAAVAVVLIVIILVGKFRGGSDSTPAPSTPSSQRSR